MNTSRFFLDRFRESFDIGRFELRKCSIFEDEASNIMRFGDFFEDFIIDGKSCFIFSQWLDTEFFEEDDLDLFWRIEIEKLTDNIIDLDLEFLDFFMDTLSDFLEFLSITTDSRILYHRKYRKES